MIRLGSKVKCKVTGFSGVVTGRVQYLHAPKQYQVQSQTGPAGAYPPSVWFAEKQLTHIVDKRKR